MLHSLRQALPIDWRVVVALTSSPRGQPGWQKVIEGRKIFGETFTAMPVYEYLCRKCGKSFELVETVKEHDLSKVRCPECKSKKVERRWSPVFAVTSKKS